jgi:3',5'-cyclic-AMP phosphodiesterase
MKTTIYTETIKGLSRSIKLANLILFSILLLSSGCDHMEFSPNEIRVDSEDQNTVDKNEVELQDTLINSDTICFAVLGDAQRWYDETTACVDFLNDIPELDFVIQTGDLTDFGLPQEFKWMKAILDRLHVPYFPVIGNHDLVGNGGDMYRDMFGDYDYSFVFGNTKFVFLNTNSLEFDYSPSVPDLNWLQGELSYSNDYDNVFLTMHVPPMSTEFNQELTVDFKEMLNDTDKLIGVVHGHTHNFQITDDYLEEIPLIGADATDKNTVLIYTITGNEVSYEKISI